MTAWEFQTPAWVRLRQLSDRQAVGALATIGAILTCLAWVAPNVHRSIGGNAWLVLLAVWTALVALAFALSKRTQSNAALATIVAIAAAMRSALLAVPPYLSNDIFRYVWDGRVQAAGINPYRYLPVAPELASLRDAAIYPNINRADYAHTIYPPVAQMIFRLIHVFGDSVLSMRLGMLAFEMLAIVGMIGILRVLSQPLTRVVAYAWHPLPVWEIVGNGHIDAAMVGLLLAGVWLYVRGRVLLAGVLVTLAACVKPTALLALPVFWRPWDWKLPAVVIAVAAAVYAPYLSVGGAVFGFFGGYLQEEGLSDGAGFRYVAFAEWVAGRRIPGIGTIYVTAAAAILIVMALRAGFRQDRSAATSIRTLGTLLVVFMVLLTPHYPWYYLALAPWLAFGQGVTPWVLTAGSFMLYNEIDAQSLPPFEWREAALYLASFATLAYDIWGGERIITLPGTKQEFRS